MTYKKAYYSWLTNDLIDLQTKRELLSIRDNMEIEDRFYKDLEFGTAGMRGLMGAGTNRINLYTLGRLTQAFADVLNRTPGEKNLIVTYDVRNHSKDFAQYIACIFASNGIGVYLSKDILATPITSFAIRKLQCQGGVIITASHNAPEYNGYKAYNSSGGQILDETARDITDRIKEIDYSDVRATDLDKALAEGKVKYLEEYIYDAYIDDVLSKSLNDRVDKDILIIYSPFNGTGARPVREVLAKRGFTNIYGVESQEKPDGNFPSLPYPNPEDPKSFNLLEDIGRENRAEVLIATDPDADRLGLMVWDQEKKDYTYLSGNEVGPLLVYYILSQRKASNTLKKNTYIVKTIVTGDLSKEIAKDFGVEIYESLTGFKNIAKLIDSKGPKEKFIFGFEEAIGYLYEDSIRDKDGISAAMLVSEMAAYYKTKSKSLLEVLENIKEKYGFYESYQFSINMKGIHGMKLMDRAMESFRSNPISELGGKSLTESKDYLKGIGDLEKSNVLKFYYGESWIAIRPSGTEPKLKFYINVKGNSKEESQELINLAKEKIKERL